MVFWHLITKEDQPIGHRLPDFRRAERLPWARPVIENVIGAQILNWDYEEGNGNIHTYLWLKDYDYLVILKRYKNNTRRLITAFYLEYNQTRKKLQKKYENRKI